MAAVDESRVTFIAMLYALAVGELANKAYGNLLQPISHGVPISELWHVLAHLVVGLVLIITSWIGWSATVDKPELIKYEGNKAIFYCLVTADVMILFLTFSLVMSTDQHFSIDLVEIEILLSIFIGYFIWGLLAFKWKDDDNKWAKDRIKENIYGVFPSIVVFGLLFIAAWLNEDRFVDEKWYVIKIDILLVLCLWLFRCIEGKGLSIYDFLFKWVRLKELVLKLKKFVLEFERPW